MGSVSMTIRKRMSALIAVLALLLGSLGFSAPAYATTPSELASLPVGFLPFDIVMTPDGNRVYVSSTDIQGNVTVIDIPSQTVVATISSGGARGYGLAITPDGTKVYVANRDSNNVGVIDVATNTLITTIPVGSTPIDVTAGLDNSKIYVANSGSNSVSVIDTATNTVQATVTSSMNQPMYMATNPVNGDVYVMNSGSNQLVRVVGTTVTGSSVSITNGSRINPSPDGTTLFVMQVPSSTTISVVDVASWQVTNTYSVGFLSFSATFSPAGDVAYVPESFYGNQVSLLNTSTGAMITGSGYPLTLTGHDPSIVSVTPDCTKAVVVMQNYPNSSSGPVGFANIIATGQPVCTPAPSPSPTPTPALAATGFTQGAVGIVELSVALLFALVVGSSLVWTSRKKNTSHS